ncbi:hypothetical protein ACFLT9_00105 [Acidobacteriota bacterium]
MSFLSFVFMLLIASITGSIGARLAGRKNLGCFTSILLGFVGALIGTYLAQWLDLPLFPWLTVNEFPIVWAVIGSALFVAFLGLFNKRKN